MAEAHKPPQDFTLRLRRFDPETGDAPYWDEHTIQLKHIDIGRNGDDVPEVSYSPVTITQWQPEERKY